MFIVEDETPSAMALPSSELLIYATLLPQARRLFLSGAQSALLHIPLARMARRRSRLLFISLPPPG